MRRLFFISLRCALFLLLISTAFMWVRSRFKSDAFGLAKMGPNDAYVKWWVQLDSWRGRCQLQVGRGRPLMVPANLAMPSVAPVPIQMPSFKENQGARPTEEIETKASFFIEAVFPEHQTGHWYPPGDPPIEWLNKSGMFGVAQVGDQGQTRVELYFPYGFVLLLLVAALIFAEWKGRKSSTGISRRCRHCGYDLRATPLRCPECGTVPGD